MNDPSAKLPTGKFPLLDLLRAGAAFVVLLKHCDALNVGWTVPFLKSAAIAVDVFMVVSGFLMYHTLTSRGAREPLDQWRTFAAFYVRRWFRIVPVYYLALLAGWTVAGRMSLSDIFLRVTFLFGLQQHPVSSGLPDWSLSLEMQYYLAAPFLVLLIKRTGCFAVCLALSIATFAANRLFGSYVIDAPGPLGNFDQPSFLPLQLAMFGIGMMLARLWSGGQPGASLRWRYAVPLAIGIAAYRHGHSYTIMLLGGLVCLGMVVSQGQRLFAVISPALNRVSSMRIVGRAAEFSYSVYLFHGVVLHWVVRAMKAGGWWRPETGFLNYALQTSLVLAATVMLAAFVYRFVELPGIALGKMAAGRILSPRLRGGLQSAP